MSIQPFTASHRQLVQRLYRSALKSALDWNIRRDLWRQKAIELRVQFERNRDVQDPRALATLFQDAQQKVQAMAHPDPYRPPLFPDGTKWERNIPPPIFSAADKLAALTVLREQNLAKF